MATHHRGVQFEKAADPIAQAEEDPRADEWADDGAGPADDRHERDLDGNLERSCDRIDEAVVVDVEHAREARDRPGNDKRRVEMHGGAIAEALHPALAALDAAQRQPERRSDKNTIAERAQDYDGEDKIIVRGLRGDADAGDRGRRYVGDAIVAAGERGPTIHRAPNNVAERDCDEDKIDPARAHCGAVKDCEQRSGNEPGRRRHDRRIAVADLEDGRGVCGHRKERRLAQRVQTGVPEQEVD